MSEVAAREFEVSLHPGQAAIFNSEARFKVCAAGRRFGKSHFAALVLGIEALKTVNSRGYDLTSEAGVYYVAPTFDQAKRIMWPKLRELLGYEAQGGFISKENVNDGWLQLINGRRIYIKGADNPDSLRGIGLSFLVLDEYADMKPQTWTEILRPALADYEGDALFIGTPKGKNHFYKTFMQALHYEQGDDPYLMWEAFHFKSMDNPFLAGIELQAMRDDPNVPLEIVKQEIDASFLSGGGSVLRPGWFQIVDRIPPMGSHTEGPNHVISSRQGGSFFVTVDLAGFSKHDGNRTSRLDETAICVAYVTPEDWYVVEIQHGQWDPRETALRIVRTASKYHGARLGIEKGALMNAVGPYLNDYMREFGRYITPEPLTHGNTKKLDRITWALQGRAERKKIHLVKGDWNEHFLDQCADFPSPLAHDDLIDALAYVDQMAVVTYADTADIEEWEALDPDAGF